MRLHLAYSPSHQMANDSDAATARVTRVRRLASTGGLRAWRERLGLSLTEAGAGADLDRTTIFRWENGTRRAHGQAALRYLAFLEELSA
jgi:DNA-binding XRE family transcriptional regulator